MGVVALHALEDDQRAGRWRSLPSPYLSLKNIERPTEPQLLDLVYEKLANRILDGRLDFTDAGNARLSRKAPQNNLLCEEVRLSSPAASICCFIASRL